MMPDRRHVFRESADDIQSRASSSDTLSIMTKDLALAVRCPQIQQECPSVRKTLTRVKGIVTKTPLSAFLTCAPWHVI